MGVYDVPIDSGSKVYSKRRVGETVDPEDRYFYTTTISERKNKGEVNHEMTTRNYEESSKSNSGTKQIKSAHDILR